MVMACQQLELELGSDSLESNAQQLGVQVVRKALSAAQAVGRLDEKVSITDSRVECDPNGVAQHSPGAKLDAGKVMPSLILTDMSRAVLAVAEVATFGANKYTKGGWLHVTNGQERYRDAADRHRLKQGFELYDPDSELLHLAHEAWNVLALLQLKLMET